MAINQNKPFLEFRNIHKAYYGNPVLKNISFSVAPGEIHGIIGENGAGKSTLMNILFGMPVIHSTKGYEGQILINGEPHAIRSPFEAMNLGIGMVHQEFMLIPELSICENIKLNKELTKKTFLSRITPKKLELLDFERMRHESKEALQKVGLTIDELLPVAGLPVGHMQFVEIAREIDNKNLKLLVFDEPTAVLTEGDAERLMKTMIHLAKDLNIALLFISHRLNEIEQVCDRVTVLRDGELVATQTKDEMNVPRMAEMMVGRKVSLHISDATKRQRGHEGNVVLELRDLRVQMPGEKVNGIDLKVRRGEILGIGGLAGQGKIGIPNGIAGIFPTTGEVLKDGDPIKLNNPRSALEKGIVFLTEDRRGTGLLLDDSIENNIVMTAMAVQKAFLHDGVLGPCQLIDKRKVRQHADKLIEELGIVCVDPRQPTRRLSGGNQQKVCIGRVLTMNPEILMVSEPTRGVDIGAKETILKKIHELNTEDGMTIILTSSELVELRAIAHRIAIVARGRIVAILPPDASDRAFGLAMAEDLKDLEVELKQMGQR